jgi:hypothetical protein
LTNPTRKTRRREPAGFDCVNDQTLCRAIGCLRRRGFVVETVIELLKSLRHVGHLRRPFAKRQRLQALGGFTLWHLGVLSVHKHELTDRFVQLQFRQTRHSGRVANLTLKVAERRRKVRVFRCCGAGVDWDDRGLAPPQITPRQGWRGEPRSDHPRSDRSPLPPIRRCTSAML